MHHICWSSSSTASDASDEVVERPLGAIGGKAADALDGQVEAFGEEVDVFKGRITEAEMILAQYAVTAFLLSKILFS